MGKHQKRHLTHVSVHNTSDLPVLTKNRFDSLIVEPSLEESCHMVNTGPVVTHSQKKDRHKGSNRGTVNTPLQDNCHIVDRGLVDTHIHSMDVNAGLSLSTTDASLCKDCPDTGSDFVLSQTQNGRCVALNSSHNNLSVTDTPYTVTTAHKDKVLQKAKEQIGIAFGCLPLSTIQLFTGEPTYYDNIRDIIHTHRLIRQSGVPNFLGLRIPIPTQLKVDR